MTPVGGSDGGNPDVGGGDMASPHSNPESSSLDWGIQEAAARPAPQRVIKM